MRVVVVKTFMGVRVARLLTRPAGRVGTGWSGRVRKFAGKAGQGFKDAPLFDVETWQNFQRHGAARGLSATAALLVLNVSRVGSGPFRPEAKI